MQQKNNCGIMLGDAPEKSIARNVPFRKLDF